MFVSMVCYCLPLLHMRSIFLLCSAVAVWALLFKLIPLFQQFLLDNPNTRSAHSIPTPRGGGLAFVLVAVAVSLITLIFQDATPMSLMPLVALPLALVGLVDDRYDLSAAFRYGVQIVTAIVVFLMGQLSVGMNGFGLIVNFFLLIAVTAIINFTNFMDGLDGLVAGCMAITLAAAAQILQAPLPIWAIVGGLLGFLFWNWSPARVFMGDVGSTFLGVVFASLVLQTTNWIDAFSLILVATPLLADAFFCVLRRWMAGKQVFHAHRQHLFQRLHQAG